MVQQGKTIAAISSAQGAGGIGVVRISGEHAIETAQQVFRAASGRPLAGLDGYRAQYGRVSDEEGEFDEAVALVFRAPHSYTGEDVVELSCHGGMFLVRRLLAAVLRAGAAAAGPGEFTRRAFLNGKMTLTQAESVMELIGAKGRQAAAAALAARDGALYREIRGAADKLLEICAHLAAWVDYPEDDIPALNVESLNATLAEVLSQLDGLLARFDSGRAVREGVETAIIGRPNVGKSTLMNLLSGYERSIVTDIPGTTRDVVEETVTLGSVTLRLADTAGLRETRDIAEAAGVERAKMRMNSAGLVLAVLDASQPISPEDQLLLRGLEPDRTVLVLNKSDLGKRVDEASMNAEFPHVAEISAATGAGVPQLAALIERVLGTDRFDPSLAMLATERQRDCALRARAAVYETMKAAEDGMTLDAVSVALDAGIAALLELTGERVTDAVVDRVFARFCVGK